MAMREIRATLTPSAPSGLTRAAKIAWLQAFVTGAGMGDAAKVHLFVNDITPTPTTVIGDFDPPTWTGYGDQEVTWAGVGGTTANGAEMIVTGSDWSSGADADATVYGWYMTDSTEAVLLWYGRFSDPIVVLGVEQIAINCSFEIE